MSNHSLCFEQKYEKVSESLSENFQFLMVEFSVYLNRRVFVMTMVRSKGVPIFRINTVCLFVTASK